MPYVLRHDAEEWTFEDLASLQTFLADYHEPVDCVLGEWRQEAADEWGPCLPDGTQVRLERWVRDVLTEPAYGGQACGPAVEIRQGVQPCEYVPPPSDPDAYLNELTGRRDCVFAQNFRDPLVLAKWAPDVMSDPVKGMKIIVREGRSGPAGIPSFKIGPSNQQNVIFTFDFEYGPEWAFSRSRLPVHKEAPVSLRFGDVLSFGRRVNFRFAEQHVENQPPGGPFIAFIVPHSETGPKMFGPGTTEGGARFPVDAPTNQQRWYQDEGMQPMAHEFGIVPARRHRIWDVLIRTPERDWINTFVRPDGSKTDLYGKQMCAYRYSMWGADTERDPILILDGALVTIGHADTTQGIGSARFSMSAGNAGRETEQLVGRGELVTFQQQWACLVGTPAEDVPDLLKKPVSVAA
jgi:hypothetical protein